MAAEDPEDASDNLGVGEESVKRQAIGSAFSLVVHEAGGGEAWVGLGMGHCPGPGWSVRLWSSRP